MSAGPDDRDRSRRPRGPDEGNPISSGMSTRSRRIRSPFQVTGVVDEEIGEPGVTGVSHEFCEAIYSGMKRDETEFVLISGLPGCRSVFSKRGFASSDFGAGRLSADQPRSWRSFARSKNLRAASFRVIPDVRRPFLGSIRPGRPS